MKIIYIHIFYIEERLYMSVFSSAELKALVSFSDHILCGVRLGINYPQVTGNLNCLKRARPFFIKGDDFKKWMSSKSSHEPLHQKRYLQETSLYNVNSNYDVLSRSYDLVSRSYELIFHTHASVFRNYLLLSHYMSFV